MQLFKHKAKTGKLYFDYDEVNHYRIIEDDSVFFIIPRTRMDTLKREVAIRRQIPSSANDTSFIAELEEMNYKKKQVDKSKFAELNQIFTEKETKGNMATSCINVYRNILVFKKNSKTIGIAKICFGCMEHLIVGASGNTDNFGQNGDYAKLRELLLN